MKIPFRRVSNADTGITLVELLVYAALSVVVVTIAGGLVANNARVNRTIQAGTQNSGVGQVIAQSLTAGVLNADWASVPTTGATQFFTVHTAGRDATLSWYCQAWYYTSANGGSIFTKTSPTAIAAPVSTSGWTLLGTGVSPLTGTTILSGTGTGISVAANVTASGANPILIKTTITKRQSAAGATSCQ